MKSAFLTSWKSDGFIIWNVIPWIRAQVIFQQAIGALAYVQNRNVVISLRNSSVRTEQVRTVGSGVAGGLTGVYIEVHISKAKWGRNPQNCTETAFLLPEPSEKQPSESRGFNGCLIHQDPGWRLCVCVCVF